MVEPYCQRTHSTGRKLTCSSTMATMQHPLSSRCRHVCFARLLLSTTSQRRRCSSHTIGRWPVKVVYALPITNTIARASVLLTQLHNGRPTQCTADQVGRGHHEGAKVTQYMIQRSQGPGPACWRAQLRALARRRLVMCCAAARNDEVDTRLLLRNDTVSIKGMNSLGLQNNGGWHAGSGHADAWYRCWWALTIAAAAFTGIFTPWQVAFTMDPTELYTFSSPASWVEAALLAVFTIDVALHFVLRLHDEDGSRVQQDEVAAAYVNSSRFWWDLIGALPLDFMLVAALGGLGALQVGPAVTDSLTDTLPHLIPPLADGATAAAGVAAMSDVAASASASAVADVSVAIGQGGLSPELPGQTLALCSLLRLTHLVRLYRVRWAFNYLEYNLAVSLLWVTVLRNSLIMLFLTHWSACMFFDVARLADFQPDWLIGANAEFFSSLPPAQQYTYSMYGYWALATLASAEFTADAPASITATVSATLRSLLFMLFNVALGAYVVGTTTLLVVKSDERTGRYRERSQNLKDFVVNNELPEDLKEKMQQHLRVHFETEEASDEAVLSIYPSTIRRRILRHLYLKYLQQSYLFQGCGQKHLDALLSAARLEVFLPQVDILAAGENVNELCIVVGGTVEVVPATEGVDEGAEGSVASVDDASGGAGSCRRLVDEGELFGEVAFFTETPQLEAIRSITVTRVLVIGRAAFESIERSFPVASRRVLENLRAKAEMAVTYELGDIPEDLYLRLVARLPSPTKALTAAAELMDVIGHKGNAPVGVLSSMDGHGGTDGGTLLDEDIQRIIEDMTPRQEQVLANLMRVQALVTDHISKLEEEATTQYLYAAARGSNTRVRQMLSQGFDVDKADYDGRTALMLASVKGHYSTVQMLLEAGAKPYLRDNFGSSALLEACTYGHDTIIDLLLSYNAALGTGGVEDASLLCTCVYEGNMPKLRRLLRAGMDVDAFDYDKRTAAHISAAEGNITAYPDWLLQLRLLVEEGRCNLSIQDRWGHTALDEAQRIGANNVVAYLIAKLSHDEDYHQQQQHPLALTGQPFTGQTFTKRSWDNAESDEEPWFDLPKGHATRLYRNVHSTEPSMESLDLQGIKRPNLARKPRMYPVGPKYSHPPAHRVGGGHTPLSAAPTSQPPAAGNNVVGLTGPGAVFTAMPAHGPSTAPSGSHTAALITGQGQTSPPRPAGPSNVPLSTSAVGHPANGPGSVAGPAPAPSARRLQRHRSYGRGSRAAQRARLSAGPVEGPRDVGDRKGL